MSRNTRNSQRTGIAATLMNLRPAEAPAQGTSVEPRHSPQPSNFSLASAQNPPVEVGQDGNPPDNPPDNPDVPNPDDQDTEDEEDGPQPEYNLAHSLELLANKISALPDSSKSASTIKPRTPDTFDGSDPGKLENFMFQCSMYIAARSKDFPEDESCVTFVLSYLKGPPLDWFQTELNHAMSGRGEFPAWFTSYPKFLVELQRLFGPCDPVNDAMNALESLKYKESTKATRYTLDFNRYARRTGWNENALARHYYKGLPDHLKDEIARVGKPSQLLLLQDLVATLDQRYWERQSEVSRDKKSANTSNTSAPKSSDKNSDRNNQNDNRSNAGSNASKQQNQQKKSEQKKPSSSSSTPSKPSIADVLGPDGKLKPEERKRRMDNKLCLRCGEAGHVVSDCPRVSKAKPKGHAATATTSTNTQAAFTSAGTSTAAGKA